jgi:DNA-damage-inducible protein J
MATTTSYVNAKVDPQVKESARRVLDSVGLDMSTAINMFLRQVIRCEGIPFEITSRTPAPAYDRSRVYRAPVSESGRAVLPSSWYEEGDDVYDDIYGARPATVTSSSPGSSSPTTPALANGGRPL